LIIEVKTYVERRIQSIVQCCLFIVSMNVRVSEPNTIRFEYRT